MTTMQIAPTVQAILLARIDRLAPEDRHLLQTAAVIGKDVPLTLLLAISEIGPAVARGRLGRLEAAEFLREVSDRPDAEYTFKHALTHEVAYGSLLDERRRALHARVVDAIERLYSDRLAEHVSTLALHAMRGEVWDKALHYCQNAGARDSARRAYGEAITAYEEAIEALGHLPAGRENPPSAIELRRSLAHILGLQGRYQRSIALLSQAEALARQLDDLAPLSSVLRVASWAGRWEIRRAPWRRHSRRWNTPRRWATPRTGRTRPIAWRRCSTCWRVFQSG